MKKEISTDQLTLIKENLSQAESAVKRVPISAITVDEKHLALGMIHVNGSPVSTSSGFYSKLGSMLKINTALTREMIKRGDTKVASSLINGLKEYQQANKKNTDVMLIANLRTKELVDICAPSHYRRISNDTLFDVTEKILNEHPNLTVETVDFNPNNGRAAINLLNNEEIGFAKAGLDEFFKFGFSIVQTNRDTTVETYNQRLVCTNGLRTSLGHGVIGANTDIHFEDFFRLNGTSTEDIRIFLNKINEMQKAGFVPGGFEQTIMRAINTKASLFEVEASMNAATKLITDPDKDMLAGYINSMKRNYFHGYDTASERITRKGVDPLSLSDRQKQFIKTGMSIWDVVNSMTFLGSNNAGYPMDDKTSLKSNAGKLFAKGVKEGYDLEFAQFANL